VVEGIESARDRIEHALPADRELLVEEALGECGIAERREAVVVALEVRAALARELAGEPFPRDRTAARSNWSRATPRSRSAPATTPPTTPCGRR
jgi:hypothetical protein